MPGYNMLTCWLNCQLASLLMDGWELACQEKNGAFIHAGHTFDRYQYLPLVLLVSFGRDTYQVS